MIRESLRRLAQLLPPLRETQIVVKWLTRLRWFAVAGQLSATAVSQYLLQLNPPLRSIMAVILVTAATNALIQWERVGRRGRAWIVPAVLLLDIGLLTVLLMCTGGPENPFAALYLVNIAMAVVALREGWTWLVVTTAVACYSALFLRHLPLSRGRPLSASAMMVGQWMALALVAGLIAYFIGRVKRSLAEHEQTLRNLRDNAARNDRLAALTTLAAGAAHELSTPLATIAVVAKEMEIASHQAAVEPSLAEDARLIRREVDRCQTILAGMRVDVAEAPAAHRLVEMTIGQLASAVRDDLDPSTAHRIRVAFTPCPVPLQLPLRAIQQVIAILIDNALAASDETGGVNVDLACDSGFLKIVVQDHGEGMDEAVLRRAGEPFFTTKPPGQGMGLGLFVVRMIAQKLGGRFELQSTPGRGACATVIIPLNPKAPEAPDPSEVHVGAIQSVDA